LKGKWVEPDVRDSVIDYVRYWSLRTEIKSMVLIGLIGISRSKYYDWGKRYGKVNEHNSWIPRDFWLEGWEKKAIIDYSVNHPLDGYRRLTYMLMDADIVAVSPSSVYRVLKSAGLLLRWNRKPTRKGNGFIQPLKVHEHWHIDISYLNIRGTFYYLCSLLDGYSRYIVHWEIRESMTEADVEIITQRAREKFPGVNPRIISDNGPQFIAKDFKEFIRICGMSHVKTSPYYPQSNGKIERWHQTLKSGCIRPKTPLSLEDAKRAVAEFVEYYNNERLHSAIRYITPKDKLEGHSDTILAERERKLDAARQKRKQRREQREEARANTNTVRSHKDTREHLTKAEPSAIMSTTGKTETGSAGEQPARDNRLGYDEYASRGVDKTTKTLRLTGAQ
jgi:putative transposase